MMIVDKGGTCLTKMIELNMMMMIWRKVPPDEQRKVPLDNRGKCLVKMIEKSVSKLREREATRKVSQSSECEKRREKCLKAQRARSDETARVDRIVASVASAGSSCRLLYLVARALVVAVAAVGGAISAMVVAAAMVVAVTAVMRVVATIRTVGGRARDE